jgi:glycosyltransferase involved in cell wall biosynthesis
MLESTRHREIVHADYRRLLEQNIRTVRSGLCWHLIEPSPYRYDFSSVLPMIRAAQELGIQMIWDLFHYGWPDDLDIFSTSFIHRFGHLAWAFSRLLAEETDETPFLTPINEISFVSWGGGDVGYLNPFQVERGEELKQQLGLAAIEAIEAIWSVLPHARIVHPEPVINVVPPFECSPEAEAQAQKYCNAQYQAWDMIAGRLWPWLGGQEKYLDILGLNYYPNNQWEDEGEPIDHRDPRHKPFRAILAEVYERYHRPLFVAETGTEDDARPDWLRRIGREVRAAIEQGVPVEGICIYPIVNHPGWDDDRYCCNGLWDYADEQGNREIYEPLARELHRQQILFNRFFLAMKHASPAGAQRKPKVDTQPLNTGNISTPSMWHRRRFNHSTVAQRGTTLDMGATICLFTDSMEPSGMGQQMLTLAGELVQDFRILFTCPPTQEGRALLERATELGCVPLAIDIQGKPLDRVKLGRWLRAMNVEVFHCHAGIGWEGHAGIYAARDSCVPVVVRTEHLPYLITQPLQRAEHNDMVDALDRLICVSREAYDSFIRNGIPAQRLAVIRNGISFTPAESDRQGVRKQFGLPAGAKIVLTVARMTAQKGHSYLLRAIPEILRREPNAYFLWVGGGPLEDELRQQMESLNIPRHHLIFGGRRDDVPQLLAASDVFALPSLFEGLPIVVLEAMASGLPVVGTRVCGTSEAIEDGLSGRLVEPADSKTLAAGIVEALTDTAQIARWREAARQRVQSHFSAQRMADEVVDLYNAMYAAHSGARRGSAWLGASHGRAGVALSGANG